MEPNREVNIKTERHYAEMDNLIIDEVNVLQLIQLVRKTDKGDFCLVLDRGESKYHFTLNEERVSDTTENILRDKGLILQILKETHANKP